MSEEYEWTEVTDEKIPDWVVAYEADNGAILYAKDERLGQTELSEEYWEEGRYTVRYRSPFRPEDVLDGFDELGEAESFVEGVIQDLEQ